MEEQGSAPGLFNFSFDDYFSSWDDLVPEEHILTPAVEHVVTVTYVIVLVVGLVCNIIICIVVARNPKLKTHQNIYIVNLAFSDILLCVFCVPFTMARLLLSNWHFGAVLCKLVPFLQGCAVLSSTLSITAIAINRYIIILRKNGSGPSMAQKSCSIFTIIMIWFVSGLFALPLLLFTYLDRIPYIEGYLYINICLEHWPSPDVRFGYACLVMVVQFLIPIILVAFLHWQICSFLKTHITIRSNLSAERIAKNTRRHGKNKIILIATAIMFGLCWFPLTLLNLLADFDHNIFLDKNFLIMFIVAHILAMISACANPVVYGWFNNNFREKFSEAVFFWKGTSTFSQSVRQNKSFLSNEFASNTKTLINSIRKKYGSI